MNDSGKSVNRVIMRIGSTTIIVLALTLPFAHFYIGWETRDMQLRMEAKMFAREVSAIISRNPDMWIYETERLEGILSGHPGDLPETRHRILTPEDGILVQYLESVPEPIMTRSYPIRDAGLDVGSIEVSLSLRPLIADTAAFTLVGAVLGTAGIFLFRRYPISALENALNMLSRERERAQVTLDSIEEGVISVGMDDRIVLVNRAAENMTGWSRAEASGKPPNEVLRLEEGFLVGRGGSRRLIETGASPLVDETGVTFGTVFVFRDITIRAEAEAELQKRQKLESLGILAAGIAHEIRNPLSTINISVSSIDRICANSEGLEPEAGEKVRIFLDQMKSAASKMTAVVQRVIEYSKPRPPQKETADLNKAVEEAIRLSLSTLGKRGIRITKSLAAELPPCRADLKMIEQVLINLIGNSCQALDDIDGEKRVEISSAARDGWIVLKVSDSGPGVPHSIRGKIFDPFFTTRKDGTGIGLSFSHRIVTEHGGRIHIDTSAWGGAEFRIELPAATAESVA